MESVTSTHGQKTPVQKAHDPIDLRQDFKKVKDSIGQAALHAKEKTEDYVDEARDMAKEKTAELQKTIVTYVKNNPLAAIGYSVLAGFLAALLIRK